MIETETIREYFSAIQNGRIVTNNAASTQVPIQLLNLLGELIVDYDNVHRGQSTASQITTERFESSYDTIAQFIGAPSRKNIVLYRNTTEAINSVMYSLMTEFRDGDNIVITAMEHNSNYIPWYGLCREILPKFGIHVEYRIVDFDKSTGLLDLTGLEKIVNDRTKMVCCTGASNFLGTKNPVKEIKRIADNSGYIQPNGDIRSYLLIDGAQMVPNMPVDVSVLDIDFLAWSFHKMLAPFGVGALYAKEDLLLKMRPFVYGGDMIFPNKVFRENVEYNILPWKFTAGTPNILGTILAAQAIRLLLDFSLDPTQHKYFLQEIPLETSDVKTALEKIESHERSLAQAALEILNDIPTITIYGPKDPELRTSLIAFNCLRENPFTIAERLSYLGIESRAGCHCATLAHRYYNLEPAASCRLSFYIYNDLNDVRTACSAVSECI